MVSILCGYQFNLILNLNTHMYQLVSKRRVCVKAVLNRFTMNNLVAAAAPHALPELKQKAGGKHLPGPAIL
jgi:hypothetical protein